MSADNKLNISQAAKVTGKSIPTIRAALFGGKLPSAISVPKGSSKSWLIPISDLVAAGLLDQVTTPSEPLRSSSEVTELKVSLAVANGKIDTLEATLRGKERELELLTQQLGEYQRRLETAEVQTARRKSWFTRS
jgi:hypothetical protein